MPADSRWQASLLSADDGQMSERSPATPPKPPRRGLCVGGGALRIAGAANGPAQGIFRVLFTIGQTLPFFPGSIGTPDGYPLLQLAVAKWKYLDGLGAILRWGHFLP